MAIKNFIVKTKQIKKGKAGLHRQLRYIHDQNRPSHKHTIIKPIISGTKLVNAYDERREMRINQGIRGGGVSNHATRFIIAIPKEISHPTFDQWKIILTEIITSVADRNGLDRKELAKHCEAVIHDESQSGKNSHIHLVMSNIINCEFVKGITQFRTTHAIKMALNRSVKKVFKVDHRFYVPKNPKPKPSGRKKKKRRFKS